MDIFILFLFILLNGLFAFSETAFISARRDILSEYATKGSRHARSILELMDEPERFLSSIQVGITLIGIVAGAYSGIALAEDLSKVIARVSWLEPYAYGLSLVVIVSIVTYLSIVVGELFPKTLALRNPEKFLLLVFPAVNAFAGAVRPVVNLLSFSTRFLLRISGLGDVSVDRDKDPIARMLGAARMAVVNKVLDEQQEKIVRNTINITTMPIKSLMITAEDIIFLDTSMSLSDALIVAHIHHHTRYPLVENDDKTKIAGYVNFKDIINAVRMKSGASTLRSICRPVLYLQDTDKAIASLRRMAVTRHHMALVRSDGRPGIVGLITVESILQAIVGDMGDEYDMPPSFAYVIAPGFYLCGGGVPMTELAALVERGVPAVTGTLNDWVQAHLQRPPKIEERIPCGGVNIVVRKTSRKRLYEAIIEVPKKSPKPA